MARSFHVAWVPVVLLAGSAGAAITIDTVRVGNPGNAADTTGYGSVGYAYNIGKYEVTAGQYCEFLNAVARTDTYGLYNTGMDYDANHNGVGCNIKRNGTPGNYTYSVASDWANRPVNYVSWGDAARFANWLHNGQRTGDQDLSTAEDGAYRLNGATSVEDLQAVRRSSGWKWAISTENEWYKAAYHKNDGVTGNYFNYSTCSDSAPRNVLETTDPGNSATYWDYYGIGTGDYTMTHPYFRTEVGEHENSASPYGTYDQGGNVYEWNEDPIYGLANVMRGGSFHYYGVDILHAASRNSCYTIAEDFDIGFRVVEVPEPVSLSLLAFGSLALIRRKRR